MKREWSPSPKHQIDPGEVLREAMADAAAGRATLALAKHLWFHKNAIKLCRSLSGEATLISKPWGVAPGWYGTRRWRSDRVSFCHRSLQNQPVGVESKPATPKCPFQIRFLDSDKNLQFS
jgi:hypothetical protein